MEQHDLFCVLGGIPLSGESAGEISVYVNTAGGNTSGGNTSGGNTSGGNTSGGNTSGGNTSGGNTSGGNTSGGNTSGGQGFAPTVLCSLQVIDLCIRYMQWCQSSHCSKLRSY